MATRSVASRVDDLESSVGSIEKGMQTILEQMEKILKQQAEVTSKLSSIPNSEGGEFSGSNGKKKESEGYDPNRFLAVKGRKLEIPAFDGTDPDGWILRAERYFSLNRLNQEEQIDVSFIAFEGDALKWLQWENKRHPMTRWEDLKRMMMRQFRSLAAGSLCEQFLAIKHGGTIDEYRRKFVEFAAPLDGIPEEVFLSQFINGLENTIKAEVHLMNPISLSDAMEMASKIEVKNRLIGRDRVSFSSRKSLSVGTESRNSQLQSGTSSNSTSKTGTEFRRLSDQEVQQKRALGLCYR